MEREKLGYPDTHKTDSAFLNPSIQVETGAGSKVVGDKGSYVRKSVPGVPTFNR